MSIYYDDLETFFSHECSGFGVITIAQGFIHNWESLAALRILLGIIEGLLLPSTLFRKAVQHQRSRAEVI